MKDDDFDWHQIDEAHDILINWIILLGYCENEELNDLINIMKPVIMSIKKADEQITDKSIVALYALKAYTEGKASWARAADISGLGYFGLKKFCDDHDVDWRELRYDKYYGYTNVEDIKKAWSKLDPNGSLKPINYYGKFKKMNRMMDK